MRYCHMSQNKDEFHITVATTPNYSHKLSIESEVMLLKTALLYADKVKFCSITTSTLTMLLGVSDLPIEELIDLYSTHNPDIKNQFHNYKILKDRKKLNKRQRVFIQQFERVIKQGREKLHELTVQQATDAGLEEIVKAFESGLLELQLFTNVGDEVTNEYFEIVSEAILSGTTYPIFDELTSNVVNEAVSSNRILPDKIHIDRGKQVALSSQLLRRLPLFDKAKIDEILDIRKELNLPLVKFRSEIIKYSKEVKSEAWNKNFHLEAEQVFIESIKPAILEIEEKCQSNSFLRSFLPDIVDKPIIPIGTSALSVLLANTGNLPEIVSTGLGLTAGASVATLRSYKEFSRKVQEIKQNNLYFYYKAGKILDK